MFKHGIRVGSISTSPVISALLADWPPEKLKEAKEAGSLLEAGEVANVVIFMLTRSRGMTIRDVVMLPTNFDLVSEKRKSRNAVSARRNSGAANHSTRFSDFSLLSVSAVTLSPWRKEVRAQ